MATLREQMIQEMTLRGLSANTQRAYLQAVSKLAQHYGRSPDRLSNREVKAYLFHLHQDPKRASSLQRQGGSAALPLLPDTRSIAPGLRHPDRARG